jgi:hypothetical protein
VASPESAARRRHRDHISRVRTTLFALAVTVFGVHAKTNKAPVELLVESEGRYRTVEIDWHGGERFRVLARDASKPDLLDKMLTPRTGRDAGVARAAAP